MRRCPDRQVDQSVPVARRAQPLADAAHLDRAFVAHAVAQAAQNDGKARRIGETRQPPGPLGIAGGLDDDDRGTA